MVGPKKNKKEKKEKKKTNKAGTLGCFPKKKAVRELNEKEF